MITPGEKNGEWTIITCCLTPWNEDEQYSVLYHSSFQSSQEFEMLIVHLLIPVFVKKYGIPSLHEN